MREGIYNLHQCKKNRMDNKIDEIEWIIETPERMLTRRRKNSHLSIFHLARTTFSALAPQIKTDDFREAEDEEEEEAQGDGRPACSSAVCQANWSSGLFAPPIRGAIAAAAAADEVVPSGKMMWTPVLCVICEEMTKL